MSKQSLNPAVRNMAAPRWTVQLLLFCLIGLQRGASFNFTGGTSSQLCPAGTMGMCISLRDKCALLNKIIDDTGD